MSTMTRVRTKSRQAYRAEQVLEIEGADNPELLRKHKNLFWLHAEMERLSDDVIDREICKRLRQFAGQIDDDLPNAVLQQIKSKRKDVDIAKIPEGLLPFYRHYEFMRKRNQKSR